MQMQMQAMTAQQQDIQQVFDSERELIELVDHKWELENAEKLLLGKVTDKKEKKE